MVLITKNAHNEETTHTNLSSLTDLGLSSRHDKPVGHNCDPAEEFELQALLVGWLFGQWVGRLKGGCVCCALMLMTSPGFWSAVVLCLCWSVAGACHWVWGLLVWAARNTRKDEMK